MSKCRVYYRPDKSVAVIHLSPKSKLSEEEGYAKCVKESGLEGLSYDDLDSSELPSRENRNAWEGEKGKGIAVNATKIQSKPKTLEERVSALEAK